MSGPVQLRWMKNRTFKVRLRYGSVLELLTNHAQVYSLSIDPLVGNRIYSKAQL
jgi:hypothetical protein